MWISVAPVRHGVGGTVVSCMISLLIEVSKPMPENIFATTYMRKAKVQPLVASILVRAQVLLFLLGPHRVPCVLAVSVINISASPPQTGCNIHSLVDTNVVHLDSHEKQHIVHTYCHQCSVASTVQRLVVLSIDLRSKYACHLPLKRDAHVSSDPQHVCSFGMGSRRLRRSAIEVDLKANQSNACQRRQQDGDKFRPPETTNMLPLLSNHLPPYCISQRLPSSCERFLRFD